MACKIQQMDWNEVTTLAESTSPAVTQNLMSANAMLSIGIDIRNDMVMIGML